MLTGSPWHNDTSATAETFELLQAQTLVMESTWSDPQFRLPPRESVIQQLLNLVDDAFQQQRTPVIHAYVLGKSQEVTKLLTQAGIPVLVTVHGLEKNCSGVGER